MTRNRMSEDLHAGLTRRVVNGSIGLLGGSALVAGATGAALLAAAGPAGAIARTLTVTTTADGTAQASDCTTPVANSCSLRDALAAASDGDTINFSVPAGSSIISNNGQFVVSDSISIVGPGRANLTIDGANGTRVFYLSNSISGAVTISGLTVARGNSGNVWGGGIAARLTGDITLSSMAFRSNVSGNSGGGFDIWGDDVVMNDIILDSNTALGASGGTINANGSVALDSIVATRNSATQGGSAFNVSGSHSVSISVTRSTFDSNTVTTGTGGLRIHENPGSGNTGSVVVSGSTFSNNSGGMQGGLFVSAPDSNVVIANSTVTGNHSRQAGAGVYLYAYGSQFTIAQSTIAGNVLDGTPSGSYVGGGGVFFAPNASADSALTITGSIISGNTNGAFHDIDGNFYGYGSATSTIAAGSSLIGTTGTTIPVTNAGGTTFGVTDPGLNPLASNGGGTKTMSLKSTSPALNAGPLTVPTFTGNTTDQRGFGFPRVSGGRADIGAFELQNRTVVFNANGGTGTMANQSLVEGSALRTVGFTRSGYTFAGWATSATGAVVYANGARFTGSTANTTLYARWMPNRTITFNANGGSGTMANQTLVTGARLTTNTFTRSGWTFAGWATSPLGAVVYANGAAYTGTANVTLYAQWKPNRTITFNANGGTGTMANQVLVVGTAIRSNTFTRSGYTFAGWSKSATGLVVYANGALFVDTANVTLFAKWTPI